MRATLLLLVAACSQIGDGAVELNWALRPASSADPDKFVDCALNGGSAVPMPVTFIRLDWLRSDGTPDHDFWNCSDNTGVTGFVLEPGERLLTVSPRCGEPGSDGDGVPADPTTYTAPATVERTVTAGDTVSLGAVQLVLEISNCDLQQCICNGH